MKKLPLGKADIVLMAVLIFGAVLLFLGGKFFFTEEPGSRRVCAYLDGKPVFTAGLEEEGSTPIVSADGGVNTIRIGDGKVRVESADCPGQDCVKQGTISQPGEEIICLPHRLVIRIEGAGAEDAPDTVAR